MIRETLILRNPLRLLGYDNDDALSSGDFGVVCARAGVGKTALLVQLAVNALLREKNVLHISLNDPVDKVTLWYKEVFHNLTQDSDAHQTDQLWQSLLPHRFIMNFKVEGFSVPKLEERLEDLVSQDIFKPEVMILDGFDFENNARESLDALKSLAEKHAIITWFTMQIHRHSQATPTEIPPPLAQLEDMFNIAIQLQPEQKKIHVKALRGVPASPESSGLFLDPSTMLVENDGILR